MNALDSSHAPPRVDRAVGAFHRALRSDTVTPMRLLAINGLLAMAVALSMVLSLSLGSVSIGFADILRSMLHAIGIGSFHPGNETVDSIILTVRLPRILLAVIIGGSIAVSGAVFQVFIRNVLADPYILGISGGASVGALAAIASGLSLMFTAAVPISAFIGAGLVAAAVFALGNRRQEGDSNSLLLSGVMIGAFLSACILILVSVAGDPVRNALFWLIGYLGNATMADNMLLYAVNIPCILLLGSRATQLNVYTLGVDTARNLGISSRALLALSYAAASLITALSVSVSGSIGFIGLIVPHIARSVFGADHRMLLPTSFLIGSLFLVLSDLAARCMLAPVELPTGAVTAAIGAPLFIYLLKRKK
jgi:iron complex transport system permease protein